MLLYLEQIPEPADRIRFEQLYHTYRGLLFYVARKILPQDQDAEDAVQEAFLAIAKNMGKITDLDSPKTRAYLVTIAEHKAIDLFRRNKGEALPLEEEVVGVTADYEGEDALAGCILRLPARYRDFILLKYDQGLNNRELGKLLSLSPAAVRKLDQRAKEKLEVLCREEGLL